MGCIVKWFMSTVYLVQIPCKFLILLANCLGNNCIFINRFLFWNSSSLLEFIFINDHLNVRLHYGRSIFINRKTILHQKCRTHYIMDNLVPVNDSLVFLGLLLLLKLLNFFFEENNEAAIIKVYTQAVNNFRYTLKSQGCFKCP